MGRVKRKRLDRKWWVVVWLMVSLGGTALAEDADGFGSYDQWASYDRPTQLWIINGIQAGGLAAYLRISTEMGWMEHPDNPMNRIMWGAEKLADLVDMIYRYEQYRHLPYSWFVVDPQSALRMIGG